MHREERWVALGELCVAIHLLEFSWFHQMGLNLRARVTSSVQQRAAAKNDALGEIRGAVCVNAPPATLPGRDPEGRAGALARSGLGGLRPIPSVQVITIEVEPEHAVVAQRSSAQTILSACLV